MSRRERVAKAAVYVEGGGRRGGKDARTEVRRAFRHLFDRAGLTERPPMIEVCGPRSEAYKDFTRALEGAQAGERLYLLVDAEAPVAHAPSEVAAWAHVQARPGDGWARPPARHDDHLHLMVQAMEAWLVADADQLETYFGAGFKRRSLPATNLERVPKDDLEPKLKAAAQDTKKKTYDKGRDSFAILAALDLAKIEAASPWARRFFDTLRRDL